MSSTDNREKLRTIHEVEVLLNDYKNQIEQAVENI